MTPAEKRVNSRVAAGLQHREHRSDNNSRTTPAAIRFVAGDTAGGRRYWTSAFFLKRAMITDRKTISIMKACELVGVSRRTIYNWIASGKVEYIRTVGGSVRIFVDTLWREPRRSSELTGKEAS